MHQVRYFLALCEEGSFVRAARSCGVAQPSLTRAIRLLEEELGGKLFNRNRNGTTLTGLGLLVRSDLTQIECSAADAKRKAEKFVTVHSTKIVQSRAMEGVMHARHIVAVLVVLIVGIGAKQFLYPARHADAASRASTTIDTTQMQFDYGNNNSLQAKPIRDLSLIFSGSD